MLSSAILRALADVYTGLMRIDPHAVGAVWYEVSLACQFGDPEAVVGIGRKQRDMRGSGIPWIADRYMQLIRSDETLLRVLKLPPELVANRRDLGRAGRETGVFNGVNHARCRKEQHHHNDDRNDGPGEFHLVAAIDLCGLTAVILGTPAEFRDRINQQTENHKKD